MPPVVALIVSKLPPAADAVYKPVGLMLPGTPVLVTLQAGLVATRMPN